METTQRSPGHGIESGIICQLGEQRLRTTNGVERLNEAIRRRERIIRIFPTHASMIRLVGTLLMEQDEGWTTGKRYFDMSAYLTVARMPIDADRSVSDC